MQTDCLLMETDQPSDGSQPVVTRPPPLRNRRFSSPLLSNCNVLDLGYTLASGSATHRIEV